MSEPTVTLPASDLLQFFCDLEHGLKYLSYKLKETARLTEHTTAYINSPADIFPPIDQRMRDIIDSAQLASTRLTIWATSVHNCTQWVLKSAPGETLQVPCLPTGLHCWQPAVVTNERLAFLPLQRNQVHHPEYTSSDVADRTAFYWRHEQVDMDATIGAQEQAVCPRSPTDSGHDEYNYTTSSENSSHYEIDGEPMRTDAKGDDEKPSHSAIFPAKYRHKITGAPREMVRAIRQKRQRSHRSHNPPPISSSPSLDNCDALETTQKTEYNSPSVTPPPAKRRRRRSHEPNGLRRHETMLLP